MTKRLRKIRVWKHKSMIICNEQAASAQLRVFFWRDVPATISLAADSIICVIWRCPEVVHCVPCPGQLRIHVNDARNSIESTRHLVVALVTDDCLTATWSLLISGKSPVGLLCPRLYREAA